MQIRLIVPLEVGGRERGMERGRSSADPLFALLLPTGRMLRRGGSVLGILLRDRVSLYMWHHWRTMNATDNEARHVFIADGMDLFVTPAITDSLLRQVYRLLDTILDFNIKRSTFIRNQFLVHFIHSF